MPFVWDNILMYEFDGASDDGKEDQANAFHSDQCDRGRHRRMGKAIFLAWCRRKTISKLPPMLASRFSDEQTSISGALTNAGFSLITSAAKSAFFNSVQSWGKKEPSFRVATRIGWNGRTYVLPDKIFNPKQNVHALLDELDPNTIAKYRAKNSLQEWQENIGKLCLNNTRLMFAVALAFTGPILRFVRGERSGGFQIYGFPETGKTTAAMVAGSVWGCRRDKPELGFLESWNTTVNAVEITALAHDDAPLILDEMKKAGGTYAKRVEVVKDVTMRLAERQAKKRLGDAPKLPSWRCYFLSTSNFSR